MLAKPNPTPPEKDPTNYKILIIKVNNFKIKCKIGSNLTSKISFTLSIRLENKENGVGCRNMTYRGHRKQVLKVTLYPTAG
jgi:hypothetical protein